jgi:ActR/RegA family two-component response regulator
MSGGGISMINAKLLVSDDEALWRETVLASLLRKEGYHVQTAPTIEDTLQRINREYFHVVFADICFSKDDHTNKDGVRTIEAVARWDEGTNTIVLTGYGTVDLAVQALRQFKVFNFLEKDESFDQNKLKSTVRQAVKDASDVFTIRNLSTPIQAITGDLDLHDAASKLQLKEDSIRWTIKNLINQVSPVLVGAGKWEIVRTRGDFVLQKVVWSRMHGQALRLCICSEGAAKKSPPTDKDRVVASANQFGVGMLIACPEIRSDEFVR